MPATFSSKLGGKMSGRLHCRIGEFRKRLVHHREKNQRRTKQRHNDAAVRHRLPGDVEFRLISIRHEPASTSLQNSQSTGYPHCVHHIPAARGIKLESVGERVTKVTAEMPAGNHPSGQIGQVVKLELRPRRRYQKLPTEQAECQPVLNRFSAPETDGHCNLAGFRAADSQCGLRGPRVVDIDPGKDARAAELKRGRPVARSWIRQWNKIKSSELPGRCVDAPGIAYPGNHASWVFSFERCPGR